MHLKRPYGHFCLCIPRVWCSKTGKSGSKTQVPQQVSGDQRISYCEEMLSNQKV